MLVFGRNVAKEILKSDKKVEKIIIQEDFNDDSVFSLIEKRGIRPQTMSKREFSRFDKYSHQGIILYIEDFKYCVLISLNGANMLSMIREKYHNIIKKIVQSNTCGNHAIDW